VATSRNYGGPYSNLDLDQVIVPGHEYVGEIVDYGPGSRRPLKPGTRVTSQPVVRHAAGRSIVGQSHDCPGGFGEYMLLDEDFLMEVPADLDDDRAAITEPLAVGLEHARRGAPTAYECVGVPGLLKQIIGSVGFGARIVMGGYCLEPEELMVFSAQNKRLTILFAAGEEKQDMELALRSIADGTIDVSSWLGGRIGLTGVADALAAMSNPSAPIRTVVDPRRM